MLEMNIVLSNDDGVHAPGIKALKKALADIAQVVVVAPLEERSTTGHTLSLDMPLRLVEIEKDVYGCSGYPADCIMMASGHVMKGRKIDLVISGINRGANLGQDIYYSGTVAAAREACFHGHKSIAVSLTVAMHGPQSEGERHYDVAAAYVRKLVQERTHERLSGFSMLNINVPNLPQGKIQGVQVTTPGFRQYSQDIDERTDCRHRKYFWVGGLYRGNMPIEGSDCMAIERDFISVTPLNLLNHPSDAIIKWKDLMSAS